MSTIIDASALASYLTDQAHGPAVADALTADAEDLHVPDLADLETASVLRGLVRGGALSPQRAALALQDLADFPAVRWPTLPLLERAWQLRDNLTLYSAIYVSLAEHLHGTLITRDAKARAGIGERSSCRIELI